MIEDAHVTGNAALRDLNPVQQEAVVHTGGPLLLLAGAGSGKTRVLTMRIAHLVHRCGVAPEDILALTFTNKAAGEMTSRIGRLLAREVRGLWIGTFHSICLRWLRRHAREAGYRPGLSVFDADDQVSLVRRLLKGEGFEEQPRRARDVLGIISRAKGRGLDAAQAASEARTPAQKVAAKIYAAYEEALLRQNAVDFDDLLLVAHKLFTAHPEIADAYGRRFRHVLVDEYQDTNHVQFRLVERLARANRNIFVVGDDDQSIYGWRGADVTNIIDFRRHFPDATVLRMEQNYRSTKSILAFANAVIRNNESRWSKELWTEREAGALPEFFLATDEDEEAEEIARRIARAVDEGRRAYGHISIFYRTHAQSRALEEAFLRSGVPYVLIGGVYFYQRREVKDLLSYLRVLNNPADGVSLRRALSVPRRGIGETTVAALLEAARERGATPLAVAADGLAKARGKARQNLEAFGQAMLAWGERLGEPPEALLHEIIEWSGYRAYLEAQGGDWEDRRANLDELLEGARAFSSSHGGGLPEYLDQVSLLTNLDSLDEQTERVTLMTAHNAKGLEFPMVFVAGLEEGLFPHVSALDDREEMEEERRLFYVACTRARDRLTLSGCLMRRRVNAAAGGVSRFVGEVDPQLYEETELQSSRWAVAPRRPSASRTGRSSAGTSHASGAGAAHSWGETDSLDHPMVGRRVFHATFGPGIVVAADGQGQAARVTVRFHTGQTRKVVSAYLEWED